MRMIERYFIMSLAMISIPVTAELAIAQQSGTLSGRVVDASTRLPIAAAQVEIGGVRQTTTRDDGTFVLQGIAAGRYELAIRRIGFLPRHDTVHMSDATFRIDIALTPAPTELPDVSVTAQRGYLGGFWERQERGMGRFFTRADLDRRKPQRLIDMFRGVEGAKVVPTAHGYAIASLRGARGLASGECVAAVFLDGMPYQMSTAGLSDFNPEDVEAIEYYSSPARVPAQFNTATGMSRPGSGFIAGHPKCGVVAIWTRGTQ